MARKSSTPKTLELLRKWGWYYWRTESFNAFSGRKTDLFNIIDYLVITKYSTIGIQSCGVDFAAHIKKFTQEEQENVIKWLSNKDRKLLLIGWRKLLKRKGGRLKIYKPRIAHIYIENQRIVIDER